MDALTWGAGSSDNRIPLTEKGKEQAREAGAKLASLVGDETVTFYVSPFLRTRQVPFYHIYLK
jgi:broad specificity phosphatase PhoE